MPRIKGLMPEPERLEVKALAEDTRIKWALKGYSDIFAILNNCSLLIRKPLQSELSGFSTFFDETFVVVLNTKYTLGHERFTGAHELYHLTFNQDVLRRERILFSDEHGEERKAQAFAAEFMMPEDAFKDSFYKLIGKDVKPDKIEARHIIRLQHAFQVSYAAALKRFIQLNLCTAKRYDFLREYGNLERAGELQELTRQEGKDVRLIQPSLEESISDEYLQHARANFENQKISYSKFSELLGYIGKNPAAYGYKKPEESL